MDPEKIGSIPAAVALPATRTIYAAVREHWRSLAVLDGPADLFDAARGFDQSVGQIWQEYAVLGRAPF